MKKIILSLTLVVLVSGIGFSQELGNYELTQLQGTGGKSPITSGLDVKISFMNENKILGGRANYQRVYVFYGYNIPKLKTQILGTAGFFDNTPWGGLEIISSPLKNFTLIGWYGHGSHPLGKKFSWNPESFFSYFAALYSFKNLTLSYSLQEFNGWMNVPGIKYTLPINGKYKAFVGMDYCIEGKEPMFRIGFEFRPVNK